MKPTHEMTIPELEAMQKEITAQIQKLKEERKQPLWNKVVEAIKEYTKYCGLIYVDTFDDCIRNDSDFREPGEIYSFDDN